MNDSLQSRYNRQLAIWLLVCASVIFGMIVLGGVTRLTGSGLSMVEWKPLMGVIPPLSEEAWQETFGKYKQYPEYQQVNRGMDLAGFKRIFAYEYAHRILGRLIGVIFFVPLVFFAWKRRIPKQHFPKLIALFVLGALQGLLGWFMVKSGLVDVPRVSQYRLVAHLGLAVIIYGYMLWVALDLLYPGRQSDPHAGKGVKGFAFSLTGLIFLMILSGGLVSGIHAGFAYNTFPLMDGRFFPVGLYGLEPAWTSIFEDITTVQFNHRMFAYLLVVLIVTFFVLAVRKGVQGRARVGSLALLAMLVIQVSLGITTLLLVVPVSLAAAHQGGAILLLTASLYLSHSLKNN
ncbi:COX15/CtaA family protein [Gilvimarinus sp. F26214L]|uniref:COX15/CtaA family protein n=1 Tax=Gilvimarinus sp. DZF01 TaxID=3461371 RepID=UPI0040461BB3